MYFSTPTNGSNPEKIRDMVEHVFKIKPDINFRVSLSLDAIGGEHDRLRRHKGLYEKVKETYNIISPYRKKFRLFLDVNTVLSSYTKDSIRETIGYVYDNFKFDNINFTYIRGNPKDPESKNVALNDYKEIADMINNLEKTRENRQHSRLIRASAVLKNKFIERTIAENKMVINCVAGRKLITIKENGDVFPCEILEKRLGNLRDFGFNLKELLRNDESKKTLHFIKKSKCFCTFECAMTANVIFHPTNYFSLIKTAFNLTNYRTD
jgi:radical SAM protein with 4Fe4S-binding SPASM domain